MNETEEHNAYSKNGDYDKIIDGYNQTIQLEPNHAGVYILRGNAYSKKGDYDKAIEDFSQAIKLYPNYEKAKQNLEEAKEALEKARKAKKAR